MPLAAMNPLRHRFIAWVASVGTAIAAAGAWLWQKLGRRPRPALSRAQEKQRRKAAVRAHTERK